VTSGVWFIDTVTRTSRLAMWQLVRSEVEMTQQQFETYREIVEETRKTGKIWLNLAILLRYKLQADWLLWALA